MSCTIVPLYGIARVAVQCNLTDIMRHGPQLPPMYAHSDNHPDYGFVSSPLLRSGAITGCGTLALNYGIISDGTGLFIEYNEEAMLRTDTAELLSRACEPEPRHSKDGCLRTEPLELLWKQIRYHGLIRKSNELQAAVQRDGPLPEHVTRHDAMEDQFDRASK